MKKAANRLAAIEKRLGALYKTRRLLVDEARDILTGCLVQPKENGPWYVVANVHESVGGHIFMVGWSFSRSTRQPGIRIFSIGALVLCHKVLPPGSDPWKRSP